MDFSRWKKATLLYSCYADVRPYRFPIFPTVFPGRSIERNLELIFGVCSYTCVCCVCVCALDLDCPQTASARKTVFPSVHNVAAIAVLLSFSRRACVYISRRLLFHFRSSSSSLAGCRVCFSRIYFANVWIKSMAILSELPLTSVGSF